MSSYRWFAVILIACGLTGTLDAQTVRTWVSVDGHDANPCTRALPCRNFDAAVAAVASNGEVVALDSGGYGSVTINKSVSIIAPRGVHAAIAPTSGTAIVIDPGVGAVVLRGLFLNAQGAEYGVNTGTIEALHIETCTFRHFSNRGVRFRGTSLVVADSSFESMSWALELSPSGNSLPIRAVIERSRFFSSAALAANSPGSITCRECVSLGSGASFWIRAQQNTQIELNLESCSITHVSPTGALTVISDGTPSSRAIARLSNTMLLDNNKGIEIFDGGCAACVSVLTRGNNILEGNTTEGSFTGSYSAK